MKKQVLIIFLKNAVYGKVKTRLAATVGDNRALKIYKQLIQYTHSIMLPLPADKIVFYSDAIDQNDMWQNGYQKQLQHGNNLGERMFNAFDCVFKNSYSEAIIIGTDCPELTQDIILNAFEKLNKYDVVIGPAADGGYYLLGIKTINRELFTEVEWSTDKVLQTTIKLCADNYLSYFLLEELHDIDEEKDLAYLRF